MAFMSVNTDKCVVLRVDSNLLEYNIGYFNN